MARPTLESLEHRSEFVRRHIGPRPADIQAMLDALGLKSLTELIEQAVPESILFQDRLDIPAARSEHEVLSTLRRLAGENEIFRSWIGMGYSGCHTPGVILRNILENPGWYTSYTPYQAEISQGRLEALLNFQTLITDLTAMEIANASLLDEGTAAAEGMAMCLALAGKKKTEASSFWVSRDCHSQTIEVLQTRAKPLGIQLVVGDLEALNFEGGYFGVLLQYPTTTGVVHDYSQVIERAHAAGALAVVAADLLSLLLLQSPGEMGADVVVGNSQRFGVPLGFGGPHAAFFATRESFRRLVPGRIVGVSVDARKRPALRLALQTREQHIRREKATSNICTAQVLLAVMAGMYAVYHGPEGLKRIASRTHRLTCVLG
ncbi:MAG: glycine dehydrogenase, partial [Planctomycetota bacterium]